MVVPRFVRQALLNEPITVYGDGTQTRSFCHVSDAISALTRLLDTPSAYGEVFNVGNDREVSIRQLAETIRTLTRSRSEILLVPYHQAYVAGFEDMQRRVPDLSKLRRWIGYQPRYSLEQTLRDVIAYVQSQLECRPGNPSPEPTP